MRSKRQRVPQAGVEHSYEKVSSSTAYRNVRVVGKNYEASRTWKPNPIDTFAVDLQRAMVSDTRRRR